MEKKIQILWPCASYFCFPIIWNWKMFNFEKFSILMLNRFKWRFQRIDWLASWNVQRQRRKNFLSIAKRKKMCLRVCDFLKSWAPNIKEVISWLISKSTFIFALRVIGQYKWNYVLFSRNLSCFIAPWNIYVLKKKRLSLNNIGYQVLVFFWNCHDIL